MQSGTIYLKSDGRILLVKRSPGRTVTREGVRLAAPLRRSTLADSGDAAALSAATAAAAADIRSRRQRESAFRRCVRSRNSRTHGTVVKKAHLALDFHMLKKLANYTPLHARPLQFVVLRSLTTERSDVSIYRTAIDERMTAHSKRCRFRLSLSVILEGKAE